VITPIYSILAADVLQSASLAADTARTLIDILDVCAMSGGFAFIAVSLFMNMKWVKFAVIYIGAVLFRVICAILTTFILNRTIGIEEIVVSVSVFTAHVIILILAICISLMIFKKFRRKQALYESHAALLSENEEEVNKDFSSLYPFTKIFDFKNSLQSILFSTSLLLSIVKMASRTISLTIEIPDSWLMTLSGYFCDMLIFPIAYAFSCFLLSFLYSINKKRKIKNN
jgi:membrane protein DedA with SNARE-associated domain